MKCPKTLVNTGFLAIQMGGTSVIHLYISVMVWALPTLQKSGIMKGDKARVRSCSLVLGRALIQGGS